MPYKLEKRGSKTCVVKKNGDGSNETVHCHASRKQAMAQMRALYANEGKKGKELTEALMQHGSDIGWDEKDLTKMLGEWEDMPFIPWGPTSFAEYDAAEDAMESFIEMEKTNSAFLSIVGNILYGDVKDRVASLHAVVDEYKARLDKLAGQNGVKSTNPDIYYEQLPDDKKDGFIDRVVSAVKEKLGIKSRENGAFMVWKDTETGAYRWLAAYSNKYRDQDYPPEILSAQAHKDFIARVEKGEDDYPELWHWHIPGSVWGKADWLCYTDEGFALASGHVLPGHEKEAEALMGMKGIRTSHGMPVKSIERSADDPTVITRYSSREISDLPASAAANMLTDFSVLEVPMPIPNDKKEYLRRVGLEDSTIASIEQSLSDKAKAADVLGLEHKSASEPASEPSTPGDAATEVKEETAPTTAVDSTTDVVAEPEKKETEQADEADLPPSRKEVADVIKPLSDAVKTIAEQLTTLAASVNALTAKVDEGQKQKTAQPEMQNAVGTSILANLLGLSPVGKESAAVKGNDASVRGPKETKAPSESRTGIPLLDRLTAPVPKEQ